MPTAEWLLHNQALGPDCGGQFHPKVASLWSILCSGPAADPVKGAIEPRPANPGTTPGGRRIKQQVFGKEPAEDSQPVNLEALRPPAGALVSEAIAFIYMTGQCNKTLLYLAEPPGDPPCYKYAIGMKAHR